MTFVLNIRETSLSENSFIPVETIPIPTLYHVKLQKQLTFLTLNSLVFCNVRAKLKTTVLSKVYSMGQQLILEVNVSLAASAHFSSWPQ